MMQILTANYQNTILEDMLIRYLQDMAKRGDQQAKILLEMMENE